MRRQILWADVRLDLSPGSELELADRLRTQPRLHNFPRGWKRKVFTADVRITLLFRWYWKEMNSFSPFMIQGISTMIILAEEMKKRTKGESVMIRVIFYSSFNSDWIKEMLHFNSYIKTLDNKLWSSWWCTWRTPCPKTQKKTKQCCYVKTEPHKVQTSSTMKDATHDESFPTESMFVHS